MAITWRTVVLALLGLAPVALWPQGSTVRWWLLVVALLVGLDVLLAGRPEALRIARGESPPVRLGETTTSTPQKPISGISGASSWRTRRNASLTGSSLPKSAWRASVATCSGESSGSSRGPSPASKRTERPSAWGITRMSEKMIAASKLKRRIGCSVTSAAASGSVASARNPPFSALSARYSGR